MLELKAQPILAPVVGGRKCQQILISKPPNESHFACGPSHIY